MDRLNIYFIAFFMIGGLFISLIFSLFSGNSVFSIIVNIIFSTFMSAIVGLVAYQVLKTKVPEFLDIFNIELKIPNRISNTTETEEELEYQSVAEPREEVEPSEDVLSYASEQTSLNETEQKVEKHFGDHILVNKISIKNEPKLMAQAIRTMLSKDE